MSAGVAASPVLPLTSSYSFLFALTSSSGLYKRGKSILLLRAPGPSQHSPVPSKLSAAPPEDPPPLGGGSYGTPSLGVKGSQGWIGHGRVLFPGEMKLGVGGEREGAPV